MSRLCQICDEAHPALFHCEDCEEDMCEIAKTIHEKSKLSKSHEIIDLIPAIDPVPTDLLHPLPDSAVSFVSVCPLHRDSYRYYDEKCQVRICRDCFALDHNGHRCVLLETAVLKKRQCCEAEYANDCRKMEEYERYLGEATKAKEMLDKEYSEIKLTIKAEMSQIIRAAEERERALLARADELYQMMLSSFTSFTTDASLIGKKLQASLDEQKKVLDVDMETMSSSTAAAKGREVDIVKANEWFVLLDSLRSLSSSLSEDKESDRKGEACCTALEGWTAIAKIHYFKDESLIASLLSEISSFGDIIGNTCASESMAEGEGLRVYEQREAQFQLTAYYSNGSRKMSGGDAIGLLLGEKDQAGNALSEFERSIQANIIDVKNGEYKVSYRAVASGIFGKIPLHVKLNGRDVKDSPFIVQFRSSSLLQLTAGNNYKISADGRKGVAKKDLAWCQLCPLPENQKIDLQLNPYTDGESFSHDGSDDGWSCLHFLPVEEPVNNSKIGSGNYGAYCWYINTGRFFVQGKLCYEEMNARKNNSRGKLSVLLKGSSLSCSIDDELVYTFPTIEPNNYKMIIDTYYNYTSVILL